MTTRQATPDTPMTTPSPSATSSTTTTLAPCSHLAQVLRSNAKDTALRNYSLAVKVIHFSKSTKFSTSHFLNKDKKPLDRAKLERLKSKVLKCKDCYVNMGNTYICLQCPHIGCMKNRHFIQHAKQQGHVFGIDGSTGFMFCFKCGNYTNDPQIEQIRLQNLHMNAMTKKSSLRDINSQDFITQYTRPTSYKATTGIRGLVNMGSTCFMNSVLQTFLHNPLIRNFFMSEGHMSCPHRPTDCITCSIDEIFTNFYTESKTCGYGPVSLLNAAWKINKALAGYSEQDAHEFWQFLANQLHTDLTDRTKNPGLPSDTDISDAACDCVIHKAFSSDLESSLTCMQCGNVTRTVDPVIDFSLGIKHSTDLVQCLRQFTGEEELDVRYSCDQCQERTNVTKKLSIKRFPNVLAIQLKRFEHTSASVKLDNFIKFPLFLNMSEFATGGGAGDVEIDPRLTYELFGIICHIGSVNTGHYVAIIKNARGEWFKFDDSVVTLMTEEQVKSVRAYLLFYMVHKLT